MASLVSDYIKEGSEEGGKCMREERGCDVVSKFIIVPWIQARYYLPVHAL